jgi:hypothetical protein
MGMIEGAIIGGVIGVAVSLGMLYQRSARRKKLLKALQKGDSSAAQMLDLSIKPVIRIPLSKIIDQRERMAGLALVNDLESLEREVKEHEGALTAVSQVNAVGLLGIAIRGDAADAARRLDDLATKLETDGSRALGLVKKKVRALAHLAAGVAGTPIPESQLASIESFAGEGGLLQLVVWQCMALAAAKAGKTMQAQGYRRRVLDVTTAFEPDVLTPRGAVQPEQSAGTSDV